MKALHDLGVAESSRALAAGQVSSLELTEHLLARVAEHDSLGCFLHLDAELALAAATAADLRRAAGSSAALLGVPLAHKDIFVTKDMPTTYGSALFKDFVPQRDATAVQRLEKAGAIILAKTTMGEFASRYVSSSAGIIRNAYDPTRNPSGSSGGSASGCRRPSTWAPRAGRFRAGRASCLRCGMASRPPSSSSPATGLPPTPRIRSSAP